MNAGVLSGLKKSKQSSSQVISVPYLIIGKNLPVVSLYFDLEQRYGEDQVCLFSSYPLTTHDLLFGGPELLRGQENIDVFKRLHPDIETTICQKESLFYKDQKFHSFAGRAKPADLRDDERFFIEPYAQYDSERLLPENFADRLMRLNNKRVDLYIKSIELLPEEKRKESGNFWQITCSDNTIYEGQYLFFAEGPYQFYKLLKNSSSYSAKFQEFCVKNKHFPSLVVNFVAQGNISEMTETLFIPQSMTHDWGYFIGEFDSYDNETNRQSFRFFTYLVDEDLSDDYISRKIALMKRVLERLFPDMKKVPLEETILVTDISPRCFSDDILFQEIREEVPHLSFLGFDAPLSQEVLEELKTQVSLNHISNLTRSLASYKDALKFTSS